MSKSDSQALRSFMLLMLLLWVCGLGPSTQAAGPAAAVEPTRPATAQKAREDAVPEKTPLKKKGRVRIATLGPRPLSLDTKAEPQKIVAQMIPIGVGSSPRSCRTGPT